MFRITSANHDVTVETPAKVNLTLRVLGKRADGFHDIESVVAAVGLFDRLRLRAADRLSLTLRPALPRPGRAAPGRSPAPGGLGGDAAVPTGDGNLVLRAARILGEVCGVRLGAEIELEKRIPVGRGFGGGSSDAAAALRGLDALWNLDLDHEELIRLGAQLGSDVPFFFGTPVAVLRGRGDRLAPVDSRPRWWLALAWPPYGMPTPDVYAAYDRLGAGGGRRTGAMGILDCLEGPAAGARPFLVNDLEAAARSLRSDGPDVRGLLERAGAPAVGMTGSGSAYFALADTEAEAQRLAEAVRAGGAEAEVARMLGS
jgi:4-diphosphocytidyl-2-C-methyl-D-erythritol kinase